MLKTFIVRVICFFILSVRSFSADVPLVPTDNGSKPGSALPVVVAPSERHLKYNGRFDFGGLDGASCEWPASSVTIKFHGTAINANLAASNNRVEVEVDGQPAKVLTSDGSVAVLLYSLAADLPDADHTVTLFKCTESDVGTVHFLGFQLNAGATVLAPPTSDKRIEVIGDSISAGYGNEAASENERFSPKTENAYWSYGAVTARAFGADYACYAWSGTCLWPQNTLPSLYDRILPQNSQSPLWNYSGQIPNVVLINLCTNDFFQGTPEEEGWVKAYHEFIAHIRKNYPEATIYLALGSMMSDAWPPGAKRLSLARSYIQRVIKESDNAGDVKIRFLEFDPQDGGKNGYGADWHPNIKTDRIMADKFIATLQADLGWKPVSSTP